jgi:hypothetical protein
MGARSVDVVFAVDILETLIDRSHEMLFSTVFDTVSGLQMWLAKSDAILRALPTEVAIALCERLIELVTG